MALTTLQQATLKTYIEANPTWMAYTHNSDGALAISQELALDASPTVVVWRSDVTEDEVVGNTSDEATVWDWTVYGALTRSEQGAYERMFARGTVDAGKPNIRQGFVDIFNGPSGADQRAHMAAISKRLANDLESVFAGGGAGTTNNPATMEVEGRVSYREILTVMGW